MNQLNSVFGSMTDTLSKLEYPKFTSEQYLEFERHWVLYALQEKRYGQAFIEHFELSDCTPLYFFRDEKISRRWIQDNYLKSDKNE